MFETAAIGSAAKFNVSEVLREAGPQVSIPAISLTASICSPLDKPQGLHIREIGEKTGTSPDRMGEMLCVDCPEIPFYLLTFSFQGACFDSWLVAISIKKSLLTCLLTTASPPFWIRASQPPKSLPRAFASTADHSGCAQTCI
jgi:hypothetical protein